MCKLKVEMMKMIFKMTIIKIRYWKYLQLECLQHHVHQQQGARIFDRLLLSRQ